jgi:transcriptional regulator with XRE-family HTH domain
MPGRRSTRPISDELRVLMDDATRRGAGTRSVPRSVRELAERVGIHQAHLSRMLAGTRPLPPAVVAAVAAEFAVAPDYFAEYRRAVVIEAAATDPALLDPVYDRLRKRRT